jgi:hypothetical protein
VVVQEELVQQEISQSAELHMLKMKHITIEDELNIPNLKLKNDILLKKLMI